MDQPSNGKTHITLSFKLAPCQKGMSISFATAGPLTGFYAAVDTTLAHQCRRGAVTPSTPADSQRLPIHILIMVKRSTQP
jgi:hypothetical protein